MPIVLTSQATPDQIRQACQDLGDYIKFVVDIRRQIVAIGGIRHVQSEELLLSSGSVQSNLWGGGVDWLTKQIDFESMINIRPGQNNPSREILSSAIRDQVARIVKTYLSLP